MGHRIHDLFGCSRFKLAVGGDGKQKVWPVSSTYCVKFYLVPCAGCEDVRLALKAVATSLVRKGMAKNIQVYCCRQPGLSMAAFNSESLQTFWSQS